MKEFKDYKAQETLINQQLGRNFRTRSEETSELDRQKLRTNNTKVNNTNKEEESSAPNSCDNEELKTLVAKWKELYIEQYKIKANVNNSDLKIINNLLIEHGYLTAEAMLRLYLEKPSPNEKENGSPLRWIGQAHNRLMNNVKEYQEEIEKGIKATEAARKYREAEQKEAEERQQEKERRAALPPLELRLLEIEDRRVTLESLMIARQVGASRGDQHEARKIEGYKAELTKLAAEENELRQGVAI